MNVLTDLTKDLPLVEDPGFKIPEETPLVLSKYEVKDDDTKDDIISDHIKLADALEIVGNKPNIHPDGPTLRVGRKNRGYIKKPDFVHL